MTEHVNIEIDSDIAQGAYVNLAMVHHAETEFVIDFIYVQPHMTEATGRVSPIHPKAEVRARVISSPVHTKRLIESLRDSISKYEQQFGTIDTRAKQ